MINKAWDVFLSVLPSQAQMWLYIDKIFEEIIMKIKFEIRIFEEIIMEINLEAEYLIRIFEEIIIMIKSEYL